MSKFKLIFLLGFVLLMLVVVSGFSFESNHYCQVEKIYLCDTSKVSFVDKRFRDTLTGRCVLRLSVEFNNQSNKLNIRSGKLIFFSLESKKDKRKVVDYRYMVTDSLCKEDELLIADYEKKIISMLKKRGFCHFIIDKSTTNFKFDFPLSFKVYP